MQLSSPMFPRCSLLPGSPLSFGSFHSLKGRSVNEASIHVLNWSKLHVCHPPPSSPPSPLPSLHLLLLLSSPPYPRFTFTPPFPSPLPSHHLLLLPPPSYPRFTFYSSFPLPLTLASPFTPYPSLSSPPPLTTKFFAAFSLLCFILSPKQRTKNGVGLLLFITSLPFPLLSPPPSPPPFLPLSLPLLHPSCLPSPSLFSPLPLWVPSFILWCAHTSIALPPHCVVCLEMCCN